MTESAKKPDDIKLGHEWTVTVDPKVSEVVFENPAGDTYTVQTAADGHGKRTAALVLNRAGDWIAADGEFSAAVK